MPRIYVAGSNGKGEIVLGKKEAHYLKNVLRAETGDKITIFDGDEAEGYIKNISSTRVVVELKNWRNVQRELGISITLGQGILKGEKMDMVLEKATEIGVDSIIPLVTERVIPRVSGKEKKSRWERIVNEATSLGGRLTPPEISLPLTLNDFLKRDFSGMKIVPWEEEKDFSLLNMLMEKRGIKEAAVVMGPEGGFSEREVNLMRGSGFETVSLGPLILRSETATIFALSCLAGLGCND